MYLPDVAVTHRVAPERASVRYFLRRCRGEGRSKAWVARLAGAAQGLSSERAYVASVLPRGVLREVGRGLRGRGSGWFAALLIILGVASTGYGFVLARLTGDRRGFGVAEPAPTLPASLH